MPPSRWERGWVAKTRMLNEIYQNLDPVIFTIGPLSVRWYGVAYVLGFALFGLVAYRLARRWKLRFDTDALLTIICCVIVGVIVGARLGYCLFYLKRKGDVSPTPVEEEERIVCWMPNSDAQ